MISYRFAFGTAGVVVLSAKPVPSMITLVFLIHLHPLRAQSSKERPISSSPIIESERHAHICVDCDPLSPSEVFVMCNSMNLSAYIQ